jgi:hypothetical protein
MKKIISIINISALTLLLGSCTALGPIVSAVSGMFGTSGDGNTTISTNIKTHVGDGSTGVANSSNRSNVDKMGARSSIAGKNTYKSEQGNIIINESSWKDIIIMAILAFVAAASIFTHVPQPKYMGKFKSIFKKRL